MIAASVSGVPLSGSPYGMEPVDEPIEQHAGDVIRIAAVDLQRGDHLLLLALDLLGRKRRIAHDVGQQVHADVERILHHDRVDEAQVGSRPGAQRAADEVDLIGDLLRRLASSCPGRAAPPPDSRRRPCLADPAPTRRGPAAACSPPAARDAATMITCMPLASVRISYGGKFDLARRQRPRRTLGRPVRDLRAAALAHGRDAKTNARPDEPAPTRRAESWRWHHRDVIARLPSARCAAPCGWSR